MKTLSKIFRGFVCALPAVLFFSYYPLMVLGFGETMNFELSLPMIWLVLFDAIVLVILIVRKVPVLKDVLKGWQWLVFPVFATISVLWSLNVVRGMLTVGVMWLIVFAIYGMWRLKDLMNDERFRVVFWRWFFGSAIMLCVWCFVQCVMDAMGVSREYSLLCPGCVSQMFGFAHPNGMAIEPQFMGNLLLAPALVTAWLCIKKQNSKILERERSRGDNFYNGSVGTRTKLQFRDSFRDRCKNYSGSRFLCSKILLFCLFLFTVTLFLTFSRGAIYAFVVAMVFLSAFVVVRERSKRKIVAKRVGMAWGVVVISFLFTLNIQGILAEVGPTSDTYQSGVAKVLNHLSLGIIDVRGEIDEPEISDNNPVFDGYVEESTNIRMELTENAVRVWSKDFRTVMFGVGIGGAGQAMYDAGLTGSPREIVQNEYASLLLETGLVGVTLALMLIVMIIKVFVKSLSNALLLTLVVAYGISLLFFSGFANALQIYLLPAVFYIVLRKKLVS